MKDKIVKLTNAVYNLLEYLPESDPLKNKAKEKALSIMENLSLVFADEGWVLLKDYFSGDREKTKLKTLEDIRTLLNYLKLARLQNWINGTSFLIIFNQYQEIVKEIGTPVVISIQEKPPLPSYKITARQGKIVAFLEKNQKAQVMDFELALGGVTKRTIRRDLDQLLKMGKIVREGEFNKVIYKIRLVS